jgi:serpin B
MGLHSMFDQKANFTDLVDSDEPLYISNIIHKAFIEVNEEGAEAAGATTALFMKRVMPLYPYFVAEHPFLFVLKDVNTHEIIFIGRFKRPVAN